VYGARQVLVLHLARQTLDILIYLGGPPGEVVAKQGTHRSRLVGRNRRGGEPSGHVDAIRKVTWCDGQFRHPILANTREGGYSFVEHSAPARPDGTENREAKFFPPRAGSRAGRS